MVATGPRTRHVTPVCFSHPHGSYGGVGARGGKSRKTGEYRGHTQDAWRQQVQCSQHAENRGLEKFKNRFFRGGAPKCQLQYVHVAAARYEGRCVGRVQGVWRAGSWQWGTAVLQ